MSCEYSKNGLIIKLWCKTKFSTKMKDDINWKQPKLKKTKMEYNKNGRRLKWKTTKKEYEDDLTQSKDNHYKTPVM